jgi:hypothetical protein
MWHFTCVYIYIYIYIYIYTHILQKTRTGCNPAKSEIIFTVRRFLRHASVAMTHHRCVRFLTCSTTVKLIRCASASIQDNSIENSVKKSMAQLKCLPVADNVVNERSWNVKWATACHFCDMCACIRIFIMHYPRKKTYWIHHLLWDSSPLDLTKIWQSVFRKSYYRRSLITLSGLYKKGKAIPIYQVSRNFKQGPAFLVKSRA